MIQRSVLGALADYYGRRLAGDIPEGFERKEIPFIVVLDREGRFVDLEDLRIIEGKKKSAPSFLVPKGEKKGTDIKPNLLWDNPGYVFGRLKPKTGPEKKDLEKEAKQAEEKRKTFLARQKDVFLGPPFDVGVVAVVTFLDKCDFQSLFMHPMWAELEESGSNLTFRLTGDTGLISERSSVMAVLKKKKKSESQSKDGTKGTRCLVTGDIDRPAKIHTAIKGVWGGQTSGTNIVSFNKRAFDSYGKDQGANAPVGEKTEFAYTTALNHLLAKGSRHRFQVGDASTVFWAEKEHKVEAWMVDLFGKADDEKAVSEDTMTVPSTFKAPLHGTSVPQEEDLTPFYVLGLSPNAARAAVRFWYAGTVWDAVRCMEAHFGDTKLVHGPKDPDRAPLFRLLTSTASQGEGKNITPNLAGDTMRAIINGTPYPWSLLSSAIRRARAEQSVPYFRAAVIKGVLARNARLKGQSEKEVGMALDVNNMNTGYLLGRLFSTLERVQSLASPGINATIRDRFYGGASSTPVAVFPHLMKLNKHHLAKIDNAGARVNHEKLIGMIVDGLADFPAHLDLADQGRFAIGYYHQTQEFFRKKTDKEFDTKENVR